MDDIMGCALVAPFKDQLHTLDLVDQHHANPLESYGNVFMTVLTPLSSTKPLLYKYDTRHKLLSTTTPQGLLYLCLVPRRGYPAQVALTFEKDKASEVFIRYEPQTIPKSISILVQQDDHKGFINAASDNQVILASQPLLFTFQCYTKPTKIEKEGFDFVFRKKPKIRWVGPVVVLLLVMLVIVLFCWCPLGGNGMINK